MVKFCVPGFNDNTLAYTDTRLAVVPAVEARRRPTTSDKRYPLWTEWRVTKDAVAPAVEGEFWKLTKFSPGGLAFWVQIISTPTAGINRLTGDSGGAVGPDVGANVNIIGGTAITVVGNPGANSLTINSTSGNLPWVEVTTTSQTMAVNTGYVTNNAAPVTVTLPVSSNFGDIVEIVGKGTGGFIIGQTGSQQITLLGQTTTAGIGGNVTPDESGGTLRLVCITATTLWRVTHSVGNFAVV